ncbi:MAG: hypothetical protein Ct9H300mP23_07920 [Nitrospinota bacterium]|nr:MAG: hypothetical protein Ct9H300mP23_07920 [Nitrospinota bacterium]
MFKPPIDLQAEESIEWTAEAKERLKKIPGFVRPMATSAILRYSLERGHSMITSSVITEAVQEILPAGAMQAMSAIGERMKKEGMDPNNPEGLGMLKEEMAEAHAGSLLKRSLLSVRAVILFIKEMLSNVPFVMLERNVSSRK